MTRTVTGLLRSSTPIAGDGAGVTTDDVTFDDL
jgi:hypothetical protein